MTPKSLPHLTTEPLSWSNISDVCANHESFFDARHWMMPLITVGNDWPTTTDLNCVIATIAPDFPWMFVTSPKIPRRSKAKGMTSLSGYVAMICRDQQIPVRERSLHDLLNALSFLMFPKAKLALNERHLLESPAGLQPGQNRTRTQDLLTMFDEGGVLRLKSDATGHDRYKDIIFGHAIYEHLVLNKKIRAARLDIPVSDGFLDNPIATLTAFADAWFAAWLKNPSQCLKSDEFSHVWIPQA